MGHGVTEINLPHFLVHVGRLLLSSTSEEQKLKGCYLLRCNITGRWLVFFSVIEFPLGSRSPLNQGFYSSVNTGDSVKGKWVIKEDRVVFPRGSKGWSEPCVLCDKCVVFKTLWPFSFNFLLSGHFITHHWPNSWFRCFWALQIDNWRFLKVFSHASNVLRSCGVKSKQQLVPDS